MQSYAQNCKWHSPPVSDDGHYAEQQRRRVIAPLLLPICEPQVGGQLGRALEGLAADGGVLVAQACIGSTCLIVGKMGMPR